MMGICFFLKNLIAYAMQNMAEDVVVNRYGLYYENDARWTAAMTIVDEALSLVDKRRPVESLSDLHYFKGRSLVGLKDFNGAMKFLKLSISEHDNDYAHYYLGISYFFSNMFSDGLSEMDALAKKTQSEHIMRDISNMYCSMKKYKESFDIRVRYISSIVKWPTIYESDLEEVKKTLIPFGLPANETVGSKLFYEKLAAWTLGGCPGSDSGRPLK